MKASGVIFDFVESDMFMTNEAGEYEFKADRLSEVHSRCLSAATDIAMTGKDFAVSNTFTKLWEMENYIELAQKFGYNVVSMVCRGGYKNVHNVPDEKVKQMMERFESE